MDRATGDLYEPLLERDLDAIPHAFDRFLTTHDEEELWTAVTRFAVLAFVPSLHSSRALMAMHAAWVVRDATAHWRKLLVACAAYAASVRPAWSEPPILERSDSAQPPDALRAAVASGDQSAAIAWLSGNVDDAEALLREIARGEALLMLETARSLEPLVGVPGRHALLRTVVLSLFADGNESTLSIDDLVRRAVESRGSVDAVRDILVWCARDGGDRQESATPFEPYELARDFAQTLLVHANLGRLPDHLDKNALLAAVHENLQHGDDYSNWSG